MFSEGRSFPACPPMVYAIPSFSFRICLRVFPRQRSRLQKSVWRQELHPHGPFFIHVYVHIYIVRMCTYISYMHVYIDVFLGQIALWSNPSRHVGKAPRVSRNTYRMQGWASLLKLALKDCLREQQGRSRHIPQHSRSSLRCAPGAIYPAQASRGATMDPGRQCGEASGTIYQALWYITVNHNKPKLHLG